MKPGDLVNHCGMIYELIGLSGEFAFIRCGTWCDCVLRSVLKRHIDLKEAMISYSVEAM